MVSKNYVKLSVFQALVLICVCSLVGLLSKTFWLFDLFNHFRPQAFLASFLLCFVSLWLKDKKGVLLAVLVMMLNAGLMLERFYAFPAVQNSSQVSYVEGQTRNISVIFSNVLTSNTNHQLLFDTISKHRPDVLVTTEVDEKWKTALEVNKSLYPFSIAIPRPDNFGMAIFSKIPFKGERYDVGDYGLPLIVLDFEDFALIAAHPIPPLSQNNSGELHAYTRKIAEAVRNIKKPLVLIGDLNATLWSDTVNDLRGLGIKRTNQLGFAWTWPSGFFPLAIQIDHIFVRDVVMADFKVLPYIGSDHFPVKTNITIKRP